MTNKEFLLNVQKTCQLDMPTCLSLMGNLQKMLAKAAIDQVPVYLQGIGVFTSHKHPEYVQENNQTGVMTLFPPRITYHMQSGEFNDVENCEHLLAEYTQLPEDQICSFITALVKTINEQLPSGDEIEVPGIGIFQNIVTHHSEMQHVAFVPSDQMKDLVNAPFSCFEPLVIGNKEEANNSEQKTSVLADKLGEESVDNVDSEINSGNIEEPDVISDNIIESEEISDKVAESEEMSDNVEEEVAELPQQEIIPEEEPSVVPDTPAKIAEKETSEEIISPSVNNSLSSYNINNEKTASSNNKLLYIAVSLILIACCGLLWLIFSDNDDDLWDNIPEAQVVNANEDHSKNVVEDTIALTANVPEDSIEVKDTIDKTLTIKEAVVEDKHNLQKEPASDVIKSEPQTKPAAVSESVKPVASAQPARADKSVSHRLIGADGKPVTVTLQPGERLTLIAERQFGSKAFWPYIFDVNSDKLKSPNQVQAGMTLYLPDPSYFDIDVNNSASVQKAKNRGAQLLK